MIEIKRTWPPAKVGLPSRHVVMRDELGNELEMVAQYGKSFVGRLKDAVVVVDDAKGRIHAASMQVFQSKIRRVRVLQHDGTLDGALRAAFQAIYESDNN